MCLFHKFIIIDTQTEVRAGSNKAQTIHTYKCIKCGKIKTKVKKHKI